VRNKRLRGRQTFSFLKRSPFPGNTGNTLRKHGGRPIFAPASRFDPPSDKSPFRQDARDEARRRLPGLKLSFPFPAMPAGAPPAPSIHVVRRTAKEIFWSAKASFIENQTSLLFCVTNSDLGPNCPLRTSLLISNLKKRCLCAPSTSRSPLENNGLSAPDSRAKPASKRVSCMRWSNSGRLFQLRVLGLGFLQDGDVGIVFSKREPHPDSSEDWARSVQPMYPEIQGSQDRGFPGDGSLAPWRAV
jgi:hypothetical protein